MDINDKIYVAGHNGLLGSAIVSLLNQKGYNNLITKSSKELDLRNSHEVDEFFKDNNPDVVILAAAKVGSIKENVECPVEFLSDNIRIEVNVINSAFKNGVENLIFVSSACIYPENSKQPLKEEYIFNGRLEVENEAYGFAKLVGLKLCQFYNKEYGTNYVTVVPTNLYGVGDKFDPEHAHVITGVMTRMHDAKINNKPYVEVWGTGNIYREFLYIDDAADAIIFLLEHPHDFDVVNIGTGIDLTIKELVQDIKNVVGYNGELKFDTSKPDGIYKRQLDLSRLKSLGWNPNITLENGLKLTYEWYLENK
ncbi:GDP-L-fucose synthase family protein [Methanobrevibacter sp.]